MLKENKIDISRDVIFVKDSKWDWNKKEVINQYDLSTEAEDREEDTQANAMMPRDSEGRGRRNTLASPLNLNFDSPEEKSSHPNKKTRSISEILLTAPYTDIEYSGTCESCYTGSEEPMLFDELENTQSGYKLWKKKSK